VKCYWSCSALLLILISPAIAARAQTAARNSAPRQHPFLRLWDRDGDGQLSPSEIDNAPAVLRSMDEDRDGRLLPAEMMAAMGRPAGQRASRGPGSPGSDQLADAGVKEGFVLPDVKAFDAEGREFVLSSLKGHYSVLVFGCLT
jgi:hypothetical protein